MFYLPIYVFVYELQVEMYCIVTSFALRANISPAQDVWLGDTSRLLNQHFYDTTAERV